MGGFLRKNQSSAFFIEFSSPFDQLFNVARAFRYKRFYCRNIAKSRACNQCIFFVQFGVVIVRQNNRNTALRVFRV